MSRKHDNVILTVWEKWPWLMDHFYIHCGDAGINLPGHSIFHLDQDVAPSGDFYIYFAVRLTDDVYAKKAEFFGVPGEKVVEVLSNCEDFMKMVKHLEGK